jgi:hypothetical protein
MSAPLALLAGRGRVGISRHDLDRALRSIDRLRADYPARDGEVAAAEIDNTVFDPPRAEFPAGKWRIEELHGIVTIEQLA